MPKMPDWLDGFASEFWARNAEMLHRLGVLTEGDGEAFAKLCLSYQAWRLAVQRAKTTPDDWHLEVAQVNAHKVYAADLQQFGMTPASRTRIHVAGHMEGGEIEDLL
jgi:P27 family predicted phage terminase small subunit